MFFLSSYFIILAIYILAAIVPAIFLMRYIYNKDKIEKEPVPLLGALALDGVKAALAAVVLESVGGRLLPFFISAGSPHYAIALAFLVVAAAEEGTKYFFLYRRTWEHPSFDYSFDAIVYSAFVSLGFAAFENVSYVFNFGITVAPARAFLAIPGHLGFSVFMGYFYGRARLRADLGQAPRRNLVLAYLAPVFLHGFYDACAMLGTGWSTLVFVIFVVVMYFTVIRLIRRESDTDSRI